MKKESGLLVLLFFGVLMGALDISIVGPAIPSIEETLHVNEKDLSWVFSIYVLFSLVGISIMAKLSDLFGRRWIYILALGIFGTGSLIVSLSTDITWLLAGRAVQGFGASGIFPVASAVIGDVFPVEKRGRVLGLIGAVFGLAFIMGPFIAGFILMSYSWNALFLINIPVVIVLMIASVFLLPSVPMKATGRVDVEGMIMMAVILGAFTFGINLVDADNLTESLSTWPILPLLLVVLILTPLMIMMEYYNKAPVFNVRLFKSMQIRLVGFIALGLGLFQSAIVFLPSLAVTSFGVDPSKASFMLLPVVLLTAFGSPINGRLVDKLGSRVIIVTGLVFATIALYILSRIAGNMNLFYVGGALLGLGLSMRAALNYIMLNEVGPSERASTQGILIIFISVGQLSGAAIVGVITSSSWGKDLGFSYTFLGMAGLSLLLMLSALFLKSRRKEIQGEMK
ncbi:MAG: MFS transporter [Bacteroidales bacterium]|nr:MFS transporter [Bacteroidales bacterium]